MAAETSGAGWRLGVGRFPARGGTDMIPLVKAYMIATALSSAGMAPAHAVDAKIGETQTCVPLAMIESTQVVDDRTVLIVMRGKDDYKRMDIMKPCPSLRTANGFSHTTSTSDLCTTDPLRVNEPVGATCSIKQIVTISAAEAAELQKRKPGQKTGE
jgi:hypothetical protein